MASDVMTLFNMPSQQELGQRYLESQMTSPAQMGNQGLLQQVTSLGGNAGAALGYAGGRLFGGGTPEQVRAKGIEEAMQAVQRMGLTSDAEMYSALSKQLAARGLTQDAFMANKEARTAMRDEQVMKKGGLDIETATVQLQKAKEDMLLDEEKIAIALSQGEETKAAGLQRQLEGKKRQAALVEAQIRAQEAKAKADLINAGANADRAASAKNDEAFIIPVYAPGIVPGTRGDIIGRQSKRGLILGNDNLIYNSVNEVMASRGTGAGTGTAAPATNEKNKPTMDIAERAAQLQAGQGSDSSQTDTTKYIRTKNNRGQYVYTYSPRGGKTKAEWATIE